MKNLLAKALFISLLLSVAAPSGVQAGSFTASDEKFTKGAAVVVAGEEVECKAKVTPAKVALRKTEIKVIRSVEKAIKTVKKLIKTAEEKGCKKDLAARTLPGVYVKGNAAIGSVLTAYYKAAEEGGAEKQEVAHKAGVEALKSARKAVEVAGEALTAEAEKLYKNSIIEVLYWQRMK